MTVIGSCGNRKNNEETKRVNWTVLVTKLSEATSSLLEIWPKLFVLREPDVEQRAAGF